MIPVVAQDLMSPCALPTPDSWQWFTETGKSRAPAWRNEVTFQSVEMFTEYEPGAYIEWISPTPLNPNSCSDEPSGWLTDAIIPSLLC